MAKVRTVSIGFGALGGSFAIVSDASIVVRIVFDRHATRNDPTNDIAD